MATVGRKGPPGKGRSGTGVQWDQQISTQGPVQSEKATSFLVCELPGLCFFCPWGLRGLSAPRAALAVEKHKERRQNTACSLFSPPREEPGGVAEGQKRDEQSDFPPLPLQVEKGVPPAWPNCCIQSTASTEILQCGSGVMAP